jgi:hypothetical protein
LPCREHVAQLCRHKNELEQLNVKVLIITFGSLTGAQNWLKETCSSFLLLLDPERKVYETYGLERSLLRSWNLKTIYAYVKLMVSGRKWRGIQGDSAQLGGDFIIDSMGIIKLAYRSHDPTDRPDFLTLLKHFR